MKSSIDINLYIADQNPHRDRSLGITTVTNCLISNFSIDHRFRLNVISSKSTNQYEECSQLILPWRTDKKIPRLITDNFHPLIIRNHADIFLYPKGYLSYFTKPKSLSVGIVHDTILDFYYTNYPDYRSKMDYIYWLGLLKKSLAKFDLVLTVSEISRKFIIEFCSKHNITCPRLEVVSLFSQFQHYTIKYEKSDFVLHLASVEPHKKTDYLLKTWFEFQQQGMKLPHLKLIGEITEKSKNYLNKCKNVSIMPRQQKDSFIEHLSKALALILPSEIEGFGLPAIEAYLLGTPVCYVKNTAVDEILSLDYSFGGFILNDKESFYKSLIQVLNMKTEDINNFSAVLRNKYTQSKFYSSVSEILLSMV